jgi:D-alanyl-lipoteichoic acid acyltransferase DltB (MBOAT superfamily)
MKARLPFFLALSIFGIGFVFGIEAGAWLVGIGVLLIGICYLPIGFRARIALLLGTGAGLAALRIGLVPAPWSDVVWPILGSMFMFRMIIFLYDTREDCGREPIVRTMAYFFMLPNVCFPLFPVVDYTRFRRNYFDSDAYEIYQTGVRWMIRGVMQLIAYRIVYLHLTIAPAEVTDGLTLLQYLITTFLLYLQISGQFHLIVGMLHLFGFNLPETNNNYLLASSFNDFWRRINIYWKDFMLKVFYYPIYFQLRRMGETQAIILSTLLVFIATWLLHSYQWFWLRGTFPIIWQDGVYWMTLSLFVAANSLYEMKYGKKKLLGGISSPIVHGLLHGVRVLATMSFVLILWSLWMANSFSAWLALWQVF